MSWMPGESQHELQRINTGCALTIMRRSASVWFPILQHSDMAALALSRCLPGTRLLVQIKPDTGRTGRWYCSLMQIVWCLGAAAGIGVCPVHGPPILQRFFD